MFIGTKSAWADDDGLENVEAKNGHEQEDNQSDVNKSLLSTFKQNPITNRISSPLWTEGETFFPTQRLRV